MTTVMLLSHLLLGEGGVVVWVWVCLGVTPTTTPTTTPPSLSPSTFPSPSPSEIHYT